MYRKKDKKELLVMIILFITCLAAVFFLIGAKNKNFGRYFIANLPVNLTTGDLYNYAEVADFSEPIKQLSSYNKNQSLNEAKILFFGDSFSRTSLDSLPLPVEIEKSSGFKTFYPPSNVDVSQYLLNNNYQNENQKVIVIETVERNIDINLGLEDRPSVETTSAPVASGLYQKLTIFLFNQTELEYFIKNNYFLKPIRLWLKQLAYQYFGDIDNMTSLYSRNPKMLFFSEEVNFNQDVNKLRPENMEKLIDKIVQLNKELKEKYNLKMILVVVPNKLSIYHDILKNDPGYDNFLPLLQGELKKCNIDYVDLYQEYSSMHQRNRNFALYYSNDTHYTASGKMILVNKLLEKIKNYLK
ncbi:hypothetical protein KKC67_01145 [Patescibacteria group bacterium]|nr:hypothetical protein [Patescibacteria group bacterium]MBU0879462.1 hypothetical protein [Patescibacteria group bacterium]MBU0880065.1 hypothetical protein [Patescibacteria group bacterium]MBU1783573.1 hypothetical protein [Patescibacteria group bacterium]MBU1991603.1 hypothetical protein [Patescibacteria group bacterium]